MPKGLKLLALAGAVAAIPGAAMAHDCPGDNQASAALSDEAAGARSGYGAGGSVGDAVIAVGDNADKHTAVNSHAAKIAHKMANKDRAPPPQHRGAGLIPKAHARAK